MIREAASPSPPTSRFVNRDTGPAQGANFEFRDARGQSAGLAPGSRPRAGSGSSGEGTRSPPTTPPTGGAGCRTGRPWRCPWAPPCGSGSPSPVAAVACAADFTRLRVASPGWGGGDLGAPSLAGSALGRPPLAGRRGGDGVLGTSDSLHLVRRRWSGDVELVAGGQPHDTDPRGRGLDDRGSAPAPCVHLSLTPPSLPLAGAVLATATPPARRSRRRLLRAVAPGWIKLTRENDTFRAFHSRRRPVDVVRQRDRPHGPRCPRGVAVSAGRRGPEHRGVQRGLRGPPPPHPLPPGERDRVQGPGGPATPSGSGDERGRWLLHEQWLGGMDSSGLPDDLSIRTTLEPLR